MKRGAKKFEDIAPFAIPGYAVQFDLRGGKYKVSLVRGKPLSVDSIHENGIGNKNDSALDCIRAANHSLSRLSALSAQGDAQAAAFLANVLCDFTERFTEIAGSNPKLFQAVASTRMRWPLMKSLHPLLSDSDSILNAVKLGSNLPFELHPSARWKPDAAGRVAICLARYLHNAWLGNVVIEYSDGQAEELQKALPPFDSDSAQTWWILGKDILLANYPEPQKIPELKKLVTAPSKLKSPGRVKQRLLEIIRLRFVSLARPPEPYQT